MPFPESERVVFRKNPIEVVICQLRFPTILEISSRDPVEFQNLVRARYPLYAKEEGPTLPKELSALLAQFPVAPVQFEGVAHKFTTADSAHVISLTRDFVAVASSSYVRWELFRDELRLAKQALEQVYQPAFYSRVGLRYRDVIVKTRLGLGDQPWHALINPAIVGVLGNQHVGQQVVGIQGQALIKLDESGGFTNLQYGVGKTATGEESYVIDADFFTDQRVDPGNVVAILNGFNVVAGNLFRWSISDRLREALEPTELEGG